MHIVLLIVYVYSRFENRAPLDHVLVALVSLLVELFLCVLVCVLVCVF